ncbi:hypothetical protein HDU97_007833 [Phlyctochytrium planicorne]|nr:hypothetical protein HDU97_007833 [Phlyctochytrium planicorne]
MLIPYVVAALAVVIMEASLPVNSQKPLTIGLALPGVTDTDFVEGIREALDFRMEQHRLNFTLHPAVRNITFLYDEIQGAGESYAIRSGFNLYNAGVTAVIGTSYSFMTQALSSVMDAYGIPVCDGASTSPTLSNKAMYPNFFRTVPQDNQQAYAMIGFLLYQKWSEIAIVASQDSYGQNLADKLMSIAKTRGITVTVRENFFARSPDYSLLISSISNSLSRIIVFCGNGDDFVDIARAASAAGIYKPGYAWITSDAVKLAASFSTVGLEYINGAINVFPSEGQGPLYTKFLSQWAATNKTRYPQAVSGTFQPYMLFYVNCLDAYVYGLSQIIKNNPNVYSTTSGWISSAYTFNVTNDFNFPDMDSVTGPVILDSNGDRLGAYSLSSFDSKILDWNIFGTYDIAGVKIDLPIVYANGSMEKPFGSLWEAAPRAIISPPNLAATLIILFTILSLLFCGVCIAGLVAFKKYKVLKTASPELSIIIIVGLMMLSFYPLVMTGEPSNWKCILEIWLLPASISIAVGTLIAKNYRVYRVFTNKFMGLAISNTMVLGWAFAILALDLVISIVWTAYDPPNVSWSLSRMGSFYEVQWYCLSKNGQNQSVFQGYFLYFLWSNTKNTSGVESGFHALLFALGILLSALTKHLPPNFNQSGPMLSVMYVCIACGVFAIALLNSIKLDKASQVIIKAFCAYAGVWLSLYNIFYPPFHSIFKEKMDVSNKGGSHATKSYLSPEEAMSVGGGTSVEQSEQSVNVHDTKFFKKNFSAVESCYLREKTALGITTWTNYIIAIPFQEQSVHLFTSRANSRTIYLFNFDWTTKMAERDPSVPKKEPFYAVKLIKSVHANLIESEMVIRFKEETTATEWLNILSLKMKKAGGVEASAKVLTTSTRAGFHIGFAPTGARDVKFFHMLLTSYPRALLALILSSSCFVSSQKPITIGLSLPGVTDTEFVEGILEALDFRMEEHRVNTSLHEAVRSLGFLYDNIQGGGESYAIRSGFNLYNAGAVAAIGTSYSYLTQALSPVMDAYGIPVCDGAATSPMLSNKEMYPNFFRTVPQDNTQAFAMIEFLLYQKWSEVAIVASQDSYGQNLANKLMEIAKNRSVTVTPSNITFEDLHVRIEFVADVDFFRFCGYGDDFVSIATAASAAGLFKSGYAWITSDAVRQAAGYSTVGLEYINGALNVFPTEGKVLTPMFTHYRTSSFRMGSYSISSFNISTIDWDIFGTYDVDGVTINKQIVYSNGSLEKPVGSLWEAAPRSVIIPPSVAAILIIVFTVLSLILCGLCLAGLIIFQKYKVLKTSSPELSGITVIGFAILSFYPLVMTGEPANWKCVLEIWLLPASIAISIGMLIAKNYRVYRVFTNKFIGLAISNNMVMGWALGILVTDLVISAVWTAYDPPKVSWSLNRMGSFYEVQWSCLSSSAANQTIFQGVEFGFHALLFALGILLSALTKHLPPNFNQSGPMLSVMYACIACGAFAIALISTIKLDKASQVIIKACCAYSGVWLCLYNIFYPPFHSIFKEKAEIAKGGIQSAYTTKSNFAPEEGMSVGGGATSITNSEQTMDAQDGKFFKKHFSAMEFCYLREKTSLGMTTWTNYIIAIPFQENCVHLFTTRSNSRTIYLFNFDWTTKMAEREPSIPKKEPFHAIKLIKSVQANVLESEFVIRFKEETTATEWLTILSTKMKKAVNTASEAASAVKSSAAM